MSDTKAEYRRKIIKFLDENTCCGVYGLKPLTLKDLELEIEYLNINCLFREDLENHRLLFFVNSIKDEEKILKGIIPILPAASGYKIIHIKDIYK